MFDVLVVIVMVVVAVAEAKVMEEIERVLAGVC